jgi:hypothetical protein
VGYTIFLASELEWLHGDDDSQAIAALSEGLS